jgi:hypothetical protein
MARNGQIPDSHCIVFAHFFKSGGGGGGRRNASSGSVKLSPTFAKIPQLEVNLEEEGNRY